MTDQDRHSYLDLISSGWVNIHGHDHPSIRSAITQQFNTLDHCFYGTYKHQPAETLMHQLKQHLPSSINHFFFSDTGSTAIEAALKIAATYWRQKGESKRKHFANLQQSYHGSTIGAMSISPDIIFNQPYKDLFFQTFSWPVADTWQNDVRIDEKEHNALASIQSSLQMHGHTIAAFVVEPLLQGVGGFKMHRASFLEKLMQLVRSYGILIIFDEVVTGFGRLGTHFAANQIAIEPDIICLAKAITGGCLPMGLTLTTDALRETVSNDFSHVSTYAANPIACSAANASHRLLCSNATQQSLHAIHTCHQRNMAILQQTLHDKLCKIRILGTIAACDVEFTHDYDTYVRPYFIRKGVIIGRLHNTLYIMPPYVITINDLEYAYHVLADAIKKYGKQF